MLLGTDNPREMEEGWDFTWFGSGVTVSESYVHSLIQEVFWYARESAYEYEELK